VFKSGWTEFLERLEGAIVQGQTLEERIEGMVRVAFEAYQADHRTVKVLILEVGRSPSGGAVNRGSEFARVLGLASGIFIEAQEKGEISTRLDPRLCAAMLFGAIEMGLTAFVLGLMDRKDPSAIDAAARQVAQTYLRGVMGARDDKLVEASQWLKEKSAVPSRAASRG
jgi:TetR/AcrR family fatty acid metabolism transcriptional regulator